MTVDLKIVLSALRKAYADAIAANPAVALRTKLLSLSGAAFQTISAGAIKSTSANGQHVSFSDSVDSGPSAADMVSVWTYLIEKFDLAKATLINGGIPQPTDDQIEAQMELYLRPISSYTDNFMFLSK